MIRERLLSASMACVVATCLASCATEVPAATYSADAAWLQRIDDTIAVAPPLTPLQEDAISRARSSGSLSYEDYSEAVRATVECIRSAGVAVDGPRAGGHVSGLPILGYGYASDMPNGAGIARSCYRANLFVIDVLYQSSPAAQVIQTEYTDRWRPALAACLDKHGITVDDSLDGLEVAQLSQETRDASDANPDCEKETGMLTAGASG